MLIENYNFSPLETRENERESFMLDYQLAIFRLSLAVSYQVAMRERFATLIMYKNAVACLCAFRAAQIKER